MKRDISKSLVWSPKSIGPIASVGSSLRFKLEQSLPSGYSQDRDNLLLLAIDKLLIKGLFPKVWEDSGRLKGMKQHPQFSTFGARLPTLGPKVSGKAGDGNLGKRAMWEVAS